MCETATKNTEKGSRKSDTTHLLVFRPQFQSHQIFHVLVIAAAFVHYHGITEMAMYRVTVGECQVPHPAIAF